MPVFADIDPQTLCIDPRAVEQRVREHPDVVGILAVHVYGNACDVDALARRHGLHILCLPLGGGTDRAPVFRIAAILRDTLKN